MPDTFIFNADEPLFREGTAAKSLYLLRTGRVSIRKSIDGGGFVEIAQVGANQIIGEIGFFDNRPRSADAVAIMYTEVIEISYDVLRPMFDPAPDYLKKIMAGLASRLRDADEVIRELKEKLGDKGGERYDPESDTQKILKMTE